MWKVKEALGKREWPPNPYSHFSAHLLGVTQGVIEKHSYARRAVFQDSAFRVPRNALTWCGQISGC